MTVLSAKKNVLGIMLETTKGTPVLPAAATDYIAMQPDFQITPANEELQNEESRNTIGEAPSIIGAESPTAGGSHYLRHSGVEGQEPNYGKVLEAAFGTKTANGTEHDTVASSTVSLIKVNTGEGASHPRGSGLLIKDNTNGWRIRAVHSVSGDDLTLGFNLPNAPGTGVNLGKCVHYSPANEGHKALTLLRHLANGGGTELVSGAMVTSVSAELTARQLLNMNFSMEALSYKFNAIQITSSTRYIDFEDDAGAKSVALEVGWYTPIELAAAAQALMDAASSNTITCAYNSTGTDAGKFTFTSNGTTFELQWSTGTNALNDAAAKFGFSGSADNTGATTYTGSAASWAAAHTPTFDAALPLVVKNNEIMIGDATDYACFEARTFGFNLSNTRTPIESICAESGWSDAIISAREATLSVQAPLKQHEAKWFQRFRDGDTVRAQASFGVKSAQKWVPGKCGYIYYPSNKLTSFSITSENDVLMLNLALRAFVPDDGAGEAYMGFL